ncbi:MAG TPA: SGNH/GDSL hydrolase family protein [Chitinivibrionales bacterium]|nr:SGNH/GDSL hydrolase family protein [Chitinivibrionales bacterium]
MQRCLLILLIQFQFIFSGCVRINSVKEVHPVKYSDWDTSFTVDHAVFSDTTTLARSIVSKGNNSRMWKFLNKISSGMAVRMGFIGGSVTAGVGASSPLNDYPSLLCSFIGKIYPGCRIEQINAGVGGTGSRFACSRAADDLLSKSPDCIIIEFAVNDDPLDSFGTMASMEGLVRQCLQNPDVPVIMLFYMNKTGDTVNQSFHDRVGSQYSLPMVSYRNVCWPLVQSGAINLDSIYFDAIHPNDHGHLICAYLLFSLMRQVALEHSADPDIPIPSPLITDLYQYAGIMKKADTSLSVAASGGWTDTLRELNRFGFISSHSADSLIIGTHTREVTIGYHVSKDHSARMEILLDNFVVDTVSNYFADDWGGGQMDLKRVFVDLGGSRSHKLTLITLDNDLFTIDYFLYAR